MRSYTPTQWSTADDKAKFEKQFKRFVESGFKETLFPKWFYQRLSCCFGHIAHYNQSGFYSTWFSSTERKRDFLANAARWQCYGQPEYTYSDVEMVLGVWIMDNRLVDKLSLQLANETESRERGVLAALKAKYEGAS